MKLEIFEINKIAKGLKHFNPQPYNIAHNHVHSCTQHSSTYLTVLDYILSAKIDELYNHVDGILLQIILHLHPPAPTCTPFTHRDCIVQTCTGENKQVSAPQLILQGRLMDITRKHMN